MVLAMSWLLLSAPVMFAALAILLNLGAALATKLSPFHNPIIPGFAPDPSCIRVDENFFCVSSSFSAFPGIPVYTSKDLVDWEQIGNVLSRPTQLPGLAAVNTSTGGIWAASIRHNEGTFYVTTTLVRDDKGINDTQRWDNVCVLSLSFLPFFISEIIPPFIDTLQKRQHFCQQRKWLVRPSSFLVQWL
jgi:hypothetical protein